MSDEARNLILFLLSHTAIEPALRSPWVVDVRLGGADAVAPLLPDTITLEIGAGEPAKPERALDQLDGEQPCILLRNVIQHVPDYRRFIGLAFDKLAQGGHLIVVVPHQFLYERKLQVPSRHDARHLRFYTPGALLAEVEEALDPCQYRVRFLADHDAGFDYAAPLHAVPGGGHDIVLCLQKLAPPPWRAAMEQDETQSAVYTRFGPFPPPYEAEANAYRVIAPDDREIRRLLVLKLDHRGDFMMATAAFRILRQAFPDAAITLVCGSWNRRDAEGLALFDRVLPFDFFPEDASAGQQSASREDLCEQFAELVADEIWDVAIDLRLYDDTRELLQPIAARHKAGFDPYDAFPWLTIPLNLMLPTVDGRAEQRVTAASQFQTEFGAHHGFAIVFPDAMEAPAGQILVYGPYIALDPGHHDLEVLIEPRAEDFELCYDLIADQGRQELGGGLIRVGRDRFPRLTLQLTEPIEGFEFRLMTTASQRFPPFRFMGLRDRRRGAFVGVHQREAMAMLAHLVPLRLQYPYRVARR